jgi:hypothetical protein
MAGYVRRTREMERFPYPSRIEDAKPSLRSAKEPLEADILCGFDPQE